MYASVCVCVCVCSSSVMFAFWDLFSFVFPSNISCLYFLSYLFF